MLEKNSPGQPEKAAGTQNRDISVTQLADAIKQLAEASAALRSTAERLGAAASKPAKSRLRRGVELAAGLIVADEVLVLLAATNPVAAAALGVVQGALTLALGLGPVSVLVDGLLLGGYAVRRYQVSGRVPTWLDSAERFLEASRRLWTRVVSGAGISRRVQGREAGSAAPQPRPQRSRSQPAAEARRGSWPAPSVSPYIETARPSPSAPLPSGGPSRRALSLRL